MPSPKPVNSVLHAIGHTPLVRLQRLVTPGMADVVVKLEYFNPTGSYKDRMALAMIEGAEKRGTLRPGMQVIEYTGGSTGSSLAMVCAMKGYPFHPLCSDAFSAEKLDTMRAFGADLEIIQSDGGKVTPALFDKFKARIAELAKDPNNFWTDQFNNTDAVDGYANIGRELAEQIGKVDAFAGMVGSGGMLVGVSQALKQAGQSTRIIALEPSTSPFLTTGKGGAHRVEGTAAGFWPPHLTKGSYDEVRVIDENAGRAMAKQAATTEGLFAGTSSGMNLTAALDLARELGPGKVVATVACDTGLKYLAGDLYK
ncbi:MAG: cysteine synthase family protein [Acidobacteriota bacterium]|nr:cysteine synthase family protein [Acidobacteriota bacterium]